MSFGFSIGDFFAVGQLAWNVYKSCKDAGGSFTELSHEVIALYTAIKELEDEIDNPDSILNRTGAGKKSELGVLVKNCNGVLQQLNKKLIKYKSLGSTSKRTWDRLRWGAENLQEIREKLLAHTSSLTLFLTTLGTGSLGRIEKKLDQLIEDVRAGRREETVLTFAIGEDDPDESEIQWSLLKGELVEDGFSKSEIEGHKHWIKAKLTELIESGGLDEQARPEDVGPSSAKHDSSQPPIYTEKEGEVSDTLKATPVVRRKSPKTVEVPKITPAEATREDAGARKKTYEAWENMKQPNSTSVDRSPASPSAPKHASAFQPTVEDADEDNENIKGDAVGVTGERQARRGPASAAQESDEDSEGVESEEDDSSEAEASGDEGIHEQPIRAPRKVATYTEEYLAAQERDTKDRSTRETDEPARQRPEREAKMATRGVKKTRGKEKRRGEQKPRYRAAYVEEESSEGTDDTFLAAVLPRDSISQVGSSPPQDNALEGATFAPEERAHKFKLPSFVPPPSVPFEPPSFVPPPPVKSRDNAPEGTKFTAEDWAQAFKPQGYVPPPPVKPRDIAPEATKFSAEEWAQSFKPQTFVSPPPVNPATRSHTRAADLNYGISDDDLSPSPPHVRRPGEPKPRYVKNDGRAVPNTSREERSRNNLDDDNLYRDDNPYTARFGESSVRYGADRSSTRKARNGNGRSDEEGRYYDPSDPLPTKSNKTSKEQIPPLPRAQTFQEFQEVPPMPRASTFQDPSRGYPEFTPNTDPRNQGPRFNFDTSNQEAGGFKFANPESIFSEFLRGQAQPEAKRAKEPAQVTVVERPVRLTLEELFRGCHKKMKIKRRVFDEVGRRATQDKILEFDIKPGLHKGSKIKFKGVGDQEEGGQQDLHFIVEEKEHPLFTRDAADLYFTLELSLVDSLCGFKRTVTTIDGKMIAIERVGLTEPESKDTYPGLGMPYSKKPEQRGNFFVKYKVRYPDTLSKRQQVQLRQVLYESPRV